MNRTLLSTGLGLLVVFQLACTSARAAKFDPFTDFYIRPAKKEPFNDLKQSINELLLCWSFFRSKDYDSFTVNSALSATDLKVLCKKKIDFLAVEDGASESLFDDASLFPYLHTVSLQSTAHNSVHLAKLARNYPQVRIVCINQDSPFTAQQAVSLRSFWHLEGLELWCPIESSALLNSVPRSITYLQIADTPELPRLPKLRELRLNRSRVGSDLLLKLDAPNLEVLYFNNIDLATGSFKGLAHLGALRDLTIYDSNFDDSELQYVRKLKILQFHSYGCREQQIGCWRNAEKLFRAKHFHQAAANYQASVYCDPSAYGYLQLARCYLKVGDIQSASKSWAGAKSIDPSCPDFKRLSEETARSG